MSCSRKQHTAAGVRTVYFCIQNRHSSHPTNMLCLLLTANNLYTTILNQGSTQSAADVLVKQKCCHLVADFEFVPVVVKTTRIIGSAGCSLLTDIGHHILKAIKDPHKMSYILQQISSPSSVQCAGYDILINEICPDLSHEELSDYIKR